MRGSCQLILTLVFKNGNEVTFEGVVTMYDMGKELQIQRCVKTNLLKPQNFPKDQIKTSVLVTEHGVEI